MSQLRLKGKWFQILAVALAFTVSFFVGKGIAGLGQPDDVAVTDKKSNLQDGGEELPVNRLNVLLMGVDARPGEKDARSDTLIVISIDKATKKIAMVSIPRDSLVDIPGHGKNKINSANALGGADLARTTVEDLLGIEIPYYVKTNFEGFKDIVDTLGGVNLDVEKRMYYPSEGINLKPGLQKLDGGKALAYVRFRHDALGDITRTQRQQKFLTALAKETMRAKTIIKLPRLVPQLMDAVETNLGVKDALFLARATSSLDPDKIVTATLPGSFFNYKGASYWKVDEDKTKIVLNELFDGLKVATISGPDINVPAEKQTSAKPKTQPKPQQSQVQINPVDNDSKQNQENPSSDPSGGNPDQQYNPEDDATPPGGAQPPSTPSGEKGTHYTGNPTIPPDANSGQPGQTYNQEPGTATGGNSQAPKGTGTSAGSQTPVSPGSPSSKGNAGGTDQNQQSSGSTSGNSANGSLNATQGS